MVSTWGGEVVPSWSHPWIPIWYWVMLPTQCCILSWGEELQWVPHNTHNWCNWGLNGVPDGVTQCPSYVHRWIQLEAVLTQTWQGWWISQVLWSSWAESHIMLNLCHGVNYIASCSVCYQLRNSRAKWMERQAKKWLVFKNLTDCSWKAHLVSFLLSNPVWRAHLNGKMGEISPLSKLERNSKKITWLEISQEKVACIAPAH